MARRALAIVVVLMAAIFSVDGLAASSTKTTSPLVIEWFADNSNADSVAIEKNLSFLRDDERVLWLSWHPSVLVGDDPLGNHDGSVRAERMGVQELPALRVELNPLENISDGNVSDIESVVEDYVNNTTVERLAIIELEVQVTENGQREGYDELMVTVEITPLTNLSEETVLYLMIVEWNHPLDDSSYRPANVVHELMPRSGIPRSNGQSGKVEFTFDSKYLDPANITIESEFAHRWGVVAMLSGHDIGSDAPRSANVGENETIFATAAVNVPSRWQLSTLDDAMPWVIATMVIIAGMAMVIHAERRREMELPKVTGKLLPGDSSNSQQMYKVEIGIKVGTMPAELTKVDSSPPWKIRRAPKRQLLEAGSESEWIVDARAPIESAHRSVNIHLSFTVDGVGDGWVMDLRLLPKNDDVEE